MSASISKSWSNSLFSLRHQEERPYAHCRIQRTEAKLDFFAKTSRSLSSLLACLLMPHCFDSSLTRLGSTDLVSIQDWETNSPRSLVYFETKFVILRIV